MKIGHFSIPFHFKPLNLPKIHKNSTITNIFKKGQEHQLKTLRDFKGVDWSTKVISNPHGKRESGISKQIKIDLTHEGITKKARIKEIETLNEAITYYNISTSKNGLKSFMPEFITVLDKNGLPIDLEKELKKCDHSIERLCKKQEYQPAYIVLRDLINEIEEHGERKVKEKGIKDIKFVKPSLLGLQIERELHGHFAFTFVEKATRGVFLKLSGCSFAFQRWSKSEWYAVIINSIKRLMAISKTKTKIHKEFEKLPKSQLRAMQEQLKNLREAIKNSGYVFADASLLFLPSTREEGGKVINELEIRLIDMSHALAKSEVTDKIREKEKILEDLKSEKKGNTQEYKRHSKELNKLNDTLKKVHIMEIDMDNSMKELEMMLGSHFK